MTTDRRLIEDFIPIKEISVEAAREKSIRKGHISTLHLWWARRPLVAARAAVFASLVAAPESYQKRSHLKKQMIDLCKWEAVPETINKAREAILEAQRDRLGLPVGTPLKDVPPPKVLDMFAGGGAIPLEALRLGCETFAVDLNPVAHIIELCTLVYPQRYGKRLADEVEGWGNWVIERVRSEIGDLYPLIRVGEVLVDRPEQMNWLSAPQPKQLSLAQGLTPVAYLWTRTVKCPNPACGADVPLVRQTWLCKKAKKYVALRVIPNHVTKRVEFEVVEASTEKDLGFDPASGSSRGNSTCRHCGTTIATKPYIQEQGKAGKIGHQLMAIVCTTEGAQGKTYLSGTTYERYVPDEFTIKSRLEKLVEETGITTPNEPVKVWSGVFNAPLYGLDQFEKLFTSRQLLALMTFVKWVRLAHDEMVQQGYEGEFAIAIATYLGIMCDRIADYNSSCTTWHNGRELIGHTFTRQALPMVWDFAEINPLGNASGNVSSALDWILNFVKQESILTFTHPAKAQRGSAMSLEIETESLDAVITDPPYFDSVPYADLSDFFYVWLKRSIGHLYAEHFSSQLTPKKNEAIMEPSRHGGDKKKAAQAYEEMMHQAFCEAYRVLKSNGNLVVVYAHKTTSGWSTLIDSLRRAGFMITEAWPLDTEMGARLRGQNSAALASSIFLVARKRNTPHPLTPSPTRGEGGQDPALTPLSLHGRGAGGEGLQYTPHPLTPSPTRGEGEQDSALTPLSLHGRGAGGEGLQYTPHPLTPSPTRGEGEQDSALTPLSLHGRVAGGEGLIGDFAIDVKPQLEQIITERVKTLMEEGVSGADLVIACIGAGLRAYTQFDKVELPNGDELDANSFLSEVQKAVVEAVLTSVMQCDKRGVSQVDKPTQYYIMARYEYGEAIVDFDEANTLAKGVGVELDGAGGLTDGKLALIQKTKNQVQLRDYSDRGADPELGLQKTEKHQTFNHKPDAIGKTPTAIDMLHRLLWLTEHKPQDIPEYLSLAQPDANQLRLVAQSLAGRALTPETNPPISLNGRGVGGEGLSRTAEQQAIDTLLASWKRAIEDNLFTKS